MSGPDAKILRAYVEAQRLDAPVRAAMLSNPMAQVNWRTVGHARLARLMPDRRACVSTPSIADLPAALERLLFERRANVVVVNGGDGTIHHTVNAALATVRRAAGVLGAPVPLPRFLFVNGGGMNMIARVFHTRGRPVRTLSRFLAASHRATLGELPHREVPLLAVREPSGHRRYGFIFGSELVLNSLTMYERFGRGYRGLAKFLGAVAWGHTLHTPLWQRFGHLLDAPATPLVIDDARFESYTCLVAVTVPMTLLKGAVGTFKRGAVGGTFNAVAVLRTAHGEVIAAIPRLAFGVPGPGLLYKDGVRAARLFGPYTLDGERVTAAEVARDAPLEVHGTTQRVRGIWVA